MMPSSWLSHARSAGLALSAALMLGCAANDPGPAADTLAAPAPAAAAEISPPEPLPLPPGEPPEFAGMLEAHNHWRRQVGTPPLSWSRAAAQIAQGWADELARRDCTISHSPGVERRTAWGENIYSYWRGGAYEGYRKTPEFVVDRWAAEAQWYDSATHTCSAPPGMVCGHFTQVVSTYSTHVGCGRSRCRSAEVWVCNYSPPGNYRGVEPY